MTVEPPGRLPARGGAARAVAIAVTAMLAMPAVILMWIDRRYLGGVLVVALGWLAWWIAGRQWHLLAGLVAVGAGLAAVGHLVTIGRWIAGSPMLDRFDELPADIYASLATTAIGIAAALAIAALAAVAVGRPEVLRRWTPGLVALCALVLLAALHRSGDATYVAAGVGLAGIGAWAGHQGRRVLAAIAGTLLVLYGLATLAFYGVATAIGCVNRGSCGWTGGEVLRHWLPPALYVGAAMVAGIAGLTGAVLRHREGRPRSPLPRQTVLIWLAGAAGVTTLAAVGYVVSRSPEPTTADTTTYATTTYATTTVAPTTAVPTTSTNPDPELPAEPPPVSVLVADNDGITIEGTDGSTTAVLEGVAVRCAFRGVDGSVIYQRVLAADYAGPPELTEPIRILDPASGGDEILVSAGANESVRPYGVTEIDGRPTLVYTRVVDGYVRQPSTREDLLLLDLVDGTEHEIGPIGPGWELHPTVLSIADGLVLASLNYDGTVLATYTLDGVPTRVWWNPIPTWADDVHAVAALSADGRHLAYTLEPIGAESSPPELIVVDLATGDPVVGVVIDEAAPDTFVRAIEIRDRTVVVSLHGAVAIVSPDGAITYLPGAGVASFW